MNTTEPTFQQAHPEHERVLDAGAIIEQLGEGPNKDLVNDLRASAGDSLQQRLDIEREIAEFVIGLHINSAVQQRAADDIAEAQRLARGATKEIIKKKQCEIDLAKIGWSPSDEKIQAELEEIPHGDETYLFGSITDQSRITKDAMSHLEREGAKDHLMKLLKENSIPVFLQNLRAGSGNLRPVSIGNRHANQVRAEHSLNTTYAAYKIDVQGTNNRALILLPEKQEDKQVVILAAMYDHTDQSKVLGTLNLKKK